MLSILQPSILQHLKDFDYGLLPVQIISENRYILIIKATKETILTARIKNEFKLYLIHDEGLKYHLGLISAFFDDHDEPIVLQSLLFEGDEMLTDVMSVFSQEEFEIYFFDEHNREFMGVKAINKEAKRFQEEMNKANFPTIDAFPFQTLLRKFQMLFSVRDSADDAKAYNIILGERLYPDDFIIMDTRAMQYGYNADPATVVTTSLEREEPGAMQEHDIAIMLGRVFLDSDIYLNPYRVDTDRELTDIFVVNDHIMLFIQAKDSPNTEEILNRSIDRKRTTIRSHIKKATDQVQGALTYARDNSGVHIKYQGNDIRIPLNGRQLIGLVVVREMFDDDYAECSAPILKAVYHLDMPISLIDYAGLHVMSQNLSNGASFVNALYNMLDVALDNNEFPKPIWSSKDRGK